MDKVSTSSYYIVARWSQQGNLHVHKSCTSSNLGYAYTSGKQQKVSFLVGRPSSEISEKPLKNLKTMNPALLL